MSETIGNGKFSDSFKSILQSPVGGWAAAVLAIGFMGWLTIQDRQAMYNDLKFLRETAMPVITKGPTVAYENQKLLEEILLLLREERRLKRSEPSYGGEP